MFISEIRENEWLGLEDKQEENIHLQAGKLDLRFSSGRILDISINGQKVISEIYFALRDCNWGTIPYRIENLVVDEDRDSFTINFTAIHDSNEIQFKWNGKIAGNADSSIIYSFDGEALSDFMRNRIGFCVLHPASCAGMECEVVHSDGKSEKGIFPVRISPHQPFMDISSIAHYPQKGVKVLVEFEGDVFEMEDQRNWTDASYKTYCTPLALPFPVRVKKGERFHQSVHVSLEADTCLEDAEAPENGNEISLLNGQIHNVGSFSLGSCITKPLTELQKQRIKAIGLSHLRYDYHFKDSPVYANKILDQVRELGVKLLLAAFFTDCWKKELDTLSVLINENVQDIMGVIIFKEGANVVDEEILAEARRKLSCSGIPIGSGTDAFFTQLNRNRLPQNSMDFVCYSNNPQVHAFDNDSIMSTVEGQVANLSSCAELYPDLPVWVTPVTLKMRWNPDATGDVIVRKGQVPPDVDIRQMSLFTASWFLRSLAACIKGGAAGVSFFELVGSKGIMEEEAPTRDYRFPAVPDMLYPVYYAFLALRDWKEFNTSIQITEDATVFVMQNSGETRIILANPRGQTVNLRLVDAPSTVKGVLIDKNNAPKLAQERVILNFDDYLENYNLNGAIQLEPYSIFIAVI
ncbi:MAG: hypothetical protein GX022_01830 [Clostridiaceae bacterium]|nr:hypothetical protein [Clostridiaceae bacterium]